MPSIALISWSAVVAGIVLSMRIGARPTRNGPGCTGAAVVAVLLGIGLVVAASATHSFCESTLGICERANQDTMWIAAYPLWAVPVFWATILSTGSFHVVDEEPVRARRPAKPFVPEPPHSLADVYTNTELFRMLREGHGGHEWLRAAHELTRPEFEARRAAGLSIVVSPLGANASSYVISVTNQGPHEYARLRIGYEPLLLNAESFGLDTTHMPHAQAQKPGEPIEIAALPVDRTIEIARVGYDAHERYDGFRETAVDVEFELNGKRYSREDKRWCPVTVELPNARAHTRISGDLFKPRG